MINFDVKKRSKETDEAIMLLASQGQSIPAEAIELQWLFRRVLALEELISVHRRSHEKVGCPGRPECYVCAKEEFRC